ncbi:MAG: dihydroorotate oxidase [Patescibacteria group bacterium]|nr:dihydroorotate oxidase [Patescibacteria group bacterium]
MIDLSVFIKDLKFNNPFLNASGVWCTTYDEIEDILKSEAGGVVFKTMTLEKRTGNPEPRLHVEKDFSINSMGLPNFGVDYYCQIVSKLKKYKKPLIASIAGFKENEFYLLAEKIKKSDFDALEVNLSCPNLEGKGIFAYDIKTSFKILKNIRKIFKKKLGAKLPPYFERETIKKISEKIIEVKLDFVSLINSYPLGSKIDIKDEKLVIKPNQGIGGLGGKIIKPISIAQVLLFNQYFKNEIDIIGVGGINDAEDVYEYILAGAKLISIGTSLLKGVKIFKKIKIELEKIIKEKKIKNLNEKIGLIKI